MIVKALQARLRVAEAPTTLVKDGRGRPPHLNTWRDGRRHLRYLLLYSPRRLFIYPGIGLALLGLLQLDYSQWPGAAVSGWTMGSHTQLIASAVMEAEGQKTPHESRNLPYPRMTSLAAAPRTQRQVPSSITTTSMKPAKCCTSAVFARST
jgi:hypothetical protein